eukprot:7702609-Ditylum_brightwellii.AAC.1
MNNISATDWETITAKQIFIRHMSTDERSLWVRLTSEKLKANGKAITDLQEMGLFIGRLFVVTQAPKKGGLFCAFQKRSDGLFPAPDLG